MQDNNQRVCAIQKMELLTKEGSSGQTVHAGDPLTIRFLVQISQEILFDPTFRLSLIRMEDGREMYTRSMGEDKWDISWLPHGSYPIEWQTLGLFLPNGIYQVCIEAALVPNGQYQSLFSVTGADTFAVKGDEGGLEGVKEIS